MPIVDRTTNTSSSNRLIRFDHSINTTRWENIDAKMDPFNVNTPAMKRDDVNAFYEIIADVCDGK
jgi:hypothetical protein